MIAHPGGRLASIKIRKSTNSTPRGCTIRGVANTLGKPACVRKRGKERWMVRGWNKRRRKSVTAFSIEAIRAALATVFTSSRLINHARDTTRKEKMLNISDSLFYIILFVAVAIKSAFTDITARIRNALIEMLALSCHFILNCFTSNERLR